MYTTAVHYRHNQLRIVGDESVPRDVMVGNTDDGRVLVTMTPAGADVLARALVRFEHDLHLEGRVQVPLDFEFDREAWHHTAIDLLTSAAHASTDGAEVVMVTGPAEAFQERA